MSLEHHLGELQARRRAAGTADFAAVPDFPLGEISLPEHVDYWAWVRPSAAAIHAGGRAITYAELSAAHQRAAGWLAAKGVGAGDTVALFTSNRPEHIVAFLAVLRLGAVCVPVDPMLCDDALVDQLADADPVLVVTEASLVARLDDVFGHSPSRLVVDANEGENWAGVLAAAPLRDVRGELDDLAAINYTAGTTGPAAGCRHTQRHMLHAAAATATALSLPDDGTFVTVWAFPISWIAGEDQAIVLPVVLGGAVVLMREWDAAAILTATERHRAVQLAGTVENYLELMSLPQIHDADLSSLRDVQALSFLHRLTPQIRQAWAHVAPGSILRKPAYGTAETQSVVCIPAAMADDSDLNAEARFCGVPVPGADVAVVAFGTLDPVPVGEPGEIVVRSGSVIEGYWGDRALTRDRLVDGWLRTGDVGRFDERGCLSYLGREIDVFAVDGRPLPPMQVESVIAQHPAVDAVVVASAEHVLVGRLPVAFVSLTTAAATTAAELERWTHARLAKAATPAVVIVDSFPTTGAGAVCRAELLAGLAPAA